jgi:hypothetical protein
MRASCAHLLIAPCKQAFRCIFASCEALLFAMHHAPAGEAKVEFVHISVINPNAKGLAHRRAGTRLTYGSPFAVQMADEKR